MNFKKIVGFMFVSFLLAETATAQQPYGGAWHPEDIKNWSPQNDPDAKFNRSRVPLAKRFKEPTLMKANSNQWYEGQVCNSTILFHTCSLCPSQGANNFTGYQPTYWQYMDKLVYWAGSASEGIIIPPPAPSIDAAHQSGVKALGQIFFPPGAFGGQRAWVRQMLTQENGKYIYAIKLYEIAKYMGFDGWFINEETGGGSTSEWVGFIKEFNKVADANGDSQMEIQWYNAFTRPNIDILKTHKNTSQFLEYGAVGDYRSYASQLGCTKEETFSKIYGGIQTVYSGLNGYGSSLRKAMPKEGHVGSVDLFCPEERIWKDNVKDILDTKNNVGEKAYAAMEKTFANENSTWTNLAGDPTVTSGSWPGFSGCVLERSVINTMPFETSFCVGIGKARYVEGEKLNTQDWYHSGVQSIMPTWRYWIENKGDLKVSIDWDDAYNFGNSLKIAGKLTAGDHLMRLYKTMIDVTAGGKLRLVYKTSTPGSIEVKLGTESKIDGNLVTLVNPTIKEKNGWIVADYDLASVKGKTVYMIALNMKADTDVNAYSLQLGELMMTSSGYSPKVLIVSNLKNETTLGEEDGDLRLTWDWEYTADFDHFDIYLETMDGTKKLVGQTRGEAFYVPKFLRNATDSYVNVALVPIMKDGSLGQKQELKVEYPKLTVPVVTVKPNKSYVTVGQEVVLTVKGTGNPTVWKWTLPSTLQIVEGSSLDNDTITVKALKEGRQTIVVEATNTAGTSKTEVDAFDVLSNQEMGDVKNVARSKKVVSFSGSTNNVEVPDKLLDGNTNPMNTSMKWCNIGSDHWCIIDLQGVYRIYGFKTYDCNAGPEKAQNFSNYRIYLSNDGETWKEVVNETDREGDNIKTDDIAPMNARYVKLNPWSETGMTLRIWEFEVYGIENNNLKVILPETMKLNAGETEHLTVKYDLGGDARATDFSCMAKASNSYISIGKIVEDKENATFTIPLTAAKAIGQTNLVVKVDNGGAYKERTIDVTIDAADAANVLKGEKAELRHYDVDYTFATEYTSYKDVATLTDGDIDTEGCEVIETPSSHKQDFWTVFEAPETWNLSKVKVYLPGENYGTNDNDKEGIVTNTVEIWTSNDGKDWTTLKKFENLERVSALEYILPEYKEVKYLAIVNTLNPFFYPSLAEVEAYEQLAEAIPDYAPVSIKSGFNADVIAESKPCKESTTDVLDDQGWVLYSASLQEKGALSDNNGVVVSSYGTKYQIGAYDRNNALVMKKANQKDTLLFTAAQNIEELYILAISANGQSKLDVAPLYEDGSEGEITTFSIDDWCGNESGTAVYGLGRIITKSAQSYRTDQIDTKYWVRLFENTLKTDVNKKMVGIRCTSTRSGSYPTVLAVSKKGRNIDTGINNNIVPIGDIKIVGIYNLNGVKLNKLQKGLNIVKYSNGKAVKVVKQ